MRRVVIAGHAVAVSVALALCGYAGLGANPDGSETLTPSKLYELIAVEQKKSARQTEILKLHAERIAKLEARVEALEKKLQATRDQTARIALKLRKQIRAVWN